MSGIAMSSPAAPLLEHLLQPLAIWLDDPAVEDVAIQEPGRAWIHHHGRWEGVEIPLTFDDLEEITFLAGALDKQDVGRMYPLCSAKLSNGERLQICLPPTVPDGTITLAARVHEQGVSPVSDVKKRYRLDGWNKPQHQSGGRDLSETLAAYDSADFQKFLEAAVKARLNILCCGATGAGKTTLSKTVISAIPHSKRIITIEDTIELQLIQPNVVRLLYSKGDLAGTNISSEVLVQAAMRLYPDIFLLQELRDEAAWSYITAICSGHPGSITTIHARYPADALRRLSVLVKRCKEGRALDRDDLLSLITSSIDIIIPLERDTEVLPRVHHVWFVGDAARRQETAGDLLRAA